MEPDTIDRLTEDDVPHAELDEAAAIEAAIAYGLEQAFRCCNSIPCRLGACEVN